MEFDSGHDPDADQNRPLGGAPAADLQAMHYSDLVERLTALGRQRTRLEGQIAAVAAEMHRRAGGRAASAMMRERLRVSSRQATAEVELAASLAGDLPSTLEALQRGEITLGHARVISRVAADPDHSDEPALLEMARGAPVDVFSRMTRNYQRVLGSAQEHHRQRDDRWASLVQDPDGSWRLSAFLDHCAGKHVSLVFNQMLRNHRNIPVCSSGADDTPAARARRRRADVLVELITGEGPNPRPRVDLLVIADYDIAARELSNLRLDDGTTIPAQELAVLAAEARILPAVFNAEGQPLWLGRGQRDASAAQRTVLAARDGGCVNCAAPAESCVPHHIRWFCNGGPTDVDNLCLLCERCHHLTHDDGWSLQRRDGRYRLQPPVPSQPGTQAPQHQHGPVKPNSTAQPPRAPPVAANRAEREPSL